MKQWRSEINELLIVTILLLWIPKTMQEAKSNLFAEYPHFKKWPEGSIDVRHRSAWFYSGLPQWSFWQVKVLLRKSTSQTLVELTLSANGSRSGDELVLNRVGVSPNSNPPPLCYVRPSTYCCWSLYSLLVVSLVLALSAKFGPRYRKGAKMKRSFATAIPVLRRTRCS